MTGRNWYYPLFLPPGTFGTYGWYVVYGYASSRYLIDGFHLSDAQPIGPCPSWQMATELADALNLTEANRCGLLSTT